MLPGASMLCGTGTSLCLAATNVCNACCTFASCFTCKPSYGASKLLYICIFMLSSILGIFLRYWGEEALSSWTKTLGVCTNAQCWGQQADYRISGAVFAFFALMSVLSAAYRPAHLGAWFLKLLFYVLLLGLTLLIPNDFWVGYSQFSRYGSILFLIVQVLIIIDFAYTAHEYLLARIDRADAELEAKGWEPGLCSSPWKALYVSSAFLTIAGSISALGVMYHFFGDCPLNQFFLSETLIVGVVLVLASLINSIGKGLLPPALLFAYNTYLVYGAITNNPDAQCNMFAVQDSQNQASIIAGCVISVLSVTWAAYANAGKADQALGVQSRHSVGGTGFPSGTQAAANPMSGPSGDVEAGKPGGVQEWRQNSSGNVAAASTGAAKGGEAASYQITSGGATGGAGDAYAEDDKPTNADRRPWLFHLIMALGGLYLGMAITNWGSADAVSPGSNPELSVASMWVRIVSQWAIYVVYVWTLTAPLCCPQRDFS